MSIPQYIAVHFDGKSFVPDEPVDMPVNQPAVVRLIRKPTEKPKTLEERQAALQELKQMLKDAPEIPLEATRRINMYDDDGR